MTRASGVDPTAVELILRDATQRLGDMWHTRRYLSTIPDGAELAEILGVTDQAMIDLVGQTAKAEPAPIRAERCSAQLASMGLPKDAIVWCQCGSGPLTHDMTMCRSCVARVASDAPTRDRRRLRLLADVAAGNVVMAHGRRSWVHLKTEASRVSAIRRELTAGTVIVDGGTTLRLTAKGRHALDAAAAEAAAEAAAAEATGPCGI